MGLQGQLNDVSDSIPLLLLAVVAHFIGYLRSLLLNLLHSAHPTRFHSASGLSVLDEQLNLNGRFSHRFGGEGDDLIGGAAECIVCLSTMRGGEQVRGLGCRHVFHKDCLDGWLNQLKFSCPLCRSPLVPAGTNLVARLSIR